MTRLILFLALFVGAGLVPSPALAPDAAPIAPVDVEVISLNRPLEGQTFERVDIASRLGQVPVEAQPTTLCGRPTKKGLPCKNRVKGDAACWRHRKI